MSKEKQVKQTAAHPGENDPTTDDLKKTFVEKLVEDQKPDLNFTPIKENWDKWDFSANDTFVGEYTGETQTLEGAGVPGDDKKPGDIVLLGFKEYFTGDKYGIINSGVLEKVDFVKGVTYKIVFTGQKKSQKTGRKVNIFNVYAAE